MFMTGLRLKAQTCDSLKLPYIMGFETSDTTEFKNWTNTSTIGQYWTKGKTEPHTGDYRIKLYQYNHTWLFTRCFQLSSSKEYLLTFWHRVSLDDYLNQNLLITIGYNINTSNIIDTIADLKEINNNWYKKQTVKFSIVKDSTYYIGFFVYGITSASISGFYLDDIEISEYNCANIHPNLGNDTLICDLTEIKLDAGEDFVHYAWNTGNAQDTLRYLDVRSTGTYTVTATDQFGCNAVSTAKTVTVYGFPTDSMLIYHSVTRTSNVNSLAICYKDSVKLKAVMNGTKPTNDFEIRWYITDSDDYSYSIGTGDSIYIKEPGVYYYRMRYLASGCIQKSKLSLNMDVGYPIEGQEISYVTVDTTTGKNMVVWKKSDYDSNTQYYKIYKETSTGGKYLKVDSVPSTDTLYVDIASNPAVKAERYDIAVLDTCGNESSMSGYPHKTIHLTINLGNNNSYNLIWDDYIGLSYTTYVIMRDTLADMSTAAEIEQVQYTINSFTDLNPYAGKTNYYSVGIASQKKSLKLKSMSNVVSSKDVGVDELQITNYELRISPNPVEQSAVISYQLFAKSTISIKVYDLMGREVEQLTINNEQLTIENAGKHEVEMNMSKIENGIYFVKLEVNGFGVVRRVVKF